MSELGQAAALSVQRGKPVPPPPSPPTKEVTAYLRYKCQDCEEISEEPGGPLYECSGCGNKAVGVENRRCENCNLFMAKLADQACSECEEGEVEEVYCVTDVDGEEHEVE